MLRIYSDEISDRYFDKELKLEGWLQDTRDLGKILFLIVRDRSQFQVTCKGDLIAKVRSIPRESVVSVKGAISENPKVMNGWELLLEEIDVLNEAETPLPLDATGRTPAELDTRLNSRIIDLRRREVADIFRKRSLVTKEIREFYRDEDFIEVNTPKIVRAGMEGGATLFRLDYFGSPAYLAQSPQLYKQMLMGSGFDRVFEIAPAFRAEESATRRHLAEFISVDAEMAFVDMGDVLDNLEGLCSRVLGKIEGFKLKEFPRLEYDEALSMVGREEMDRQAEVELSEKMGDGLFFILDYPAREKPFYIMRRNGKTLSFDLFYRGIELSSGGQREHRYSVLKGNIEKSGLNLEDFVYYLEPFRYGMPPHGGYGLGLDRLIQAMMGLENVREAILFPRDRFRCHP